MRRLGTMLAVGTIVWLGSALGFAAPNVEDLAGGSLEIEFESWGCFHHEKRTITIRGEHAFTATISGGSNPADHGGVVPLTARDVERLDQLVRFYRNPSGEECSTTEHVNLTWRLADRVYRESYEDRSCGPMCDSPLGLLELGGRLRRPEGSQPDDGGLAGADPPRASRR